jgi:hypothetical protein
VSAIFLALESSIHDSFESDCRYVSYTTYRNHTSWIACSAFSQTPRQITAEAIALLFPA